MLPKQEIFKHIPPLFSQLNDYSIFIAFEISSKPVSKLKNAIKLPT